MRRLGTLSLTMLWLVGGVPAAMACIRAGEADTLIGVSRDGAYALYGLAGRDGTFAHAEIHPTRAEGWLYWIWPKGLGGEKVGVVGDIEVRKVSQTRCSPWENGAVVESAPGKLTRDRLLSLETVAALGMVASEDVRWLDGTAARVTFKPDARYADHTLVIDHPEDRLDAELVVPVWCVGSCLRDEEYRRWTARLVSVAHIGTRVIYRVRMEKVCNGASGRALWMERLIAAPDPAAKPPPRRTCKGAG